MDETTTSTLKRKAEARCGHRDRWVRDTEPGSTAKACWDCLLDVYFEHRGV